MPYAPIAPDLNYPLFRFADYPFLITLLFAVNLFIGGLGFFWLLRCLGIGSAGALFGATAYLLSGETVTLVYAGHINKVMTYAWIPFAIAGFMTGLRDRNLWAYAFSGAALGLSLLAGEVQVPYYIGLWFAAWT